MDTEGKNQLTASLEDYLEAIKELVDATAHSHAHTSDIAQRLQVRRPSVTNAMGVLRNLGLIHYDTSKPVTLTEQGEREALRVIRRHVVLSRFLREVLALDEQVASATACQIEHVIDDGLLARLAVLTDELASPGRHKPFRNLLRKRYAAVDAGQEDVLAGVYVPPPKPERDEPKRRKRRKQPAEAEQDLTKEVPHDA